MFKGLFNAVVDTVALPVDLTLDAVKRVADPRPQRELTRTERRVRRIEEDIDDIFDLDE